MTSSVARNKVGIFSNFWNFRNRSSNTDDQSFFVMGDAAAVRGDEEGRQGSGGPSMDAESPSVAAVTDGHFVLL